MTATTDDRRAPADAFTPPDVEALETGRCDLHARLHEAQVETLSAHMPRAEAETLVTVDEHFAAQVTATATGGWHAGQPVGDVAGALAALRERLEADPAPSADPLAAHRQPDWPEPPAYDHPPTRTGQLLLAIDEQIAGSLAVRNQALRDQLRTALAERLRERSMRQDAQVRLAQAETELAALRAGRAKDRDRIAELVLTLRALGEKTDPAGHESAASDEEGGE